MNDIPVRKFHGRFSMRVRSRIAPRQWLLGGVLLMFAFALFIIPTWPTRIIALFVVGLAALLVWPYSYGPGYTYPIETSKSLGIRRRDGQVAPLEKTGKSAARAKVFEPIPVRIAAFPTASPDRKSLGVFHFTQTAADSTFVFGDAWQGSNVDFRERFDAENDLSKSILDAANMSAESVGIIIGAHKGPVDIWRSRDWNANNVHSNVVNAGRLDFAQNPPTNVHERQSQFFSELDTSRRLFTRDVTGFVGLNVARGHDFNKIAEEYRAGKIDVRQFENRVLVSRMTRRLEENLRAQGVSNVRVPDEMGARDYAKRTFALGQELEDWDYLLRHPDAINALAMSPFDRFWPWTRKDPRALRDSQGRPYLNLDSSYLRVARAVRINESLYPGELKPLFMAGDIGLANESSLTVSMSGMTYSAKEESKALTYAILLQKAISGVFSADDRYMSAEEEAEANKLRERQDNLYHGGAQALGFNLFLAWGAMDEAGLFDADRAIEEHARSCDIKLEYVPLESRQVPAFFSAHFGGFLL